MSKKPPFTLRHAAQEHGQKWAGAADLASELGKTGIVVDQSEFDFFGHGVIYWPKLRTLTRCAILYTRKKFLSSFFNIDIAGFPSRVRKLRGEQNLRDFAVRIGVSASQVSLYERGENLPGVDVVKRLADATGRSFVWIMAGEEVNNDVPVAKGDHESWERLSRADRRRLEKVEDIFRGSEDRTKQRLRAVIDLIE